MKHLVVSDYGTFLGLRDGMLLVRHCKEEKLYPLNRLTSISIAKKGVTISSNLIEILSVRGIKLFFLNFKGVSHAVLIGNVRHGVVTSRCHQYRYIDTKPLELACKVISAKLKNQRATISYYAKHHRHPVLEQTRITLKQYAFLACSATSLEQLLGYEGAGAACYFNALRESCLLPETFTHREGRGSCEITNSMLNIGYAILSSYILGAVENAGLEPYLGFIHTERPGKMSLVLDLMEEYRSWVVDRAVIKLRYKCHGHLVMTSEIKKKIISEIQNTCSKKYYYRKKKVKLEHIIQRQVYRLSGQFSGDKKYRPYLFKW